MNLKKLSQAGANRNRNRNRTCFFCLIFDIVIVKISHGTRLLIRSFYPLYPVARSAISRICSRMFTRGCARGTNRAKSSMVEPSLYGYYKIGEECFLVRSEVLEGCGALHMFKFIYEGIPEEESIVPDAIKHVPSLTSMNGRWLERRCTGSK